MTTKQVPQATESHHLPKDETDVSLVSFLRNSPLAKSDLNLSRDKSLPRELDMEQSSAELLNPWVG